ncbi:hypothetical protein BDZ89DRAFT_1029558 [Hymenopellis radicata]|nr:hypothetical protein BDZ89DRAFT_1029558 [Hymenopellis radicata]
MLRRDQAKGFDRLEPEGFYDAIQAYGLPASIADFDRSAQADVPYRVKTFYGLTSRFIVSGVTKQGGPLSPLKCTLTSSLGNHWLADTLRETDDIVTIRTVQGTLREPHLPADRLLLPISMVEAMDDSIVVTRSLSSCLSTTEMAERFQSAYGASTNWDKSALFVRNVDNLPSHLQVNSVDSVDQSILVPKQVSVIRSHVELLRVAVNDPVKQAQLLEQIILTTDLPPLRRRMPMTLIRRVISQCVISRVRPKLAFQPISDQDATRLDHILAKRLHEHLHGVFPFNSSLLSLPLHMWGFEWPSIARLNRTVAVTGMLRDLNHHIASFRNMALITMADWTCLLNSCSFPLRPLPQSTAFLRSASLPFAWRLAHHTMAMLDISVRCTDVSFFFHGDVSLSHVHRMLHAASPQPVSHRLITNLASVGITLLKHVSHAPLGPHPILQQFLPLQPSRPQFAQTDTRLADQWPEIAAWIQSLSVSRLTSADLADLAIPRMVRMRLAEQTIHALLSSSTQPCLDIASASHLSATDASMIPASPTFRERRSVTMSFASTKAAGTLTLDAYGSSAFVYLGEVYALVLDILSHYAYASDEPPSQSHSILTDYLSSTRIIHSALSTVQSPHVWSSLPGCSLYRWILYLLRYRPPNVLLPTITHTPAHTASQSTPARANAHVDGLASSSQHLALRPPAAPLPTFFMDAFMLYSEHDKYIESNISKYLEAALTSCVFSAPDFRPATTLLLPLYDEHPPPAHSYVRASSAYSPMVQLYARSSQLDTQYTRFLRFGDVSPLCPFGCGVLDTTHHIFVECPQFHHMRLDASTSAAHQASVMLNNADAPLATVLQYSTLARALFRDGPRWPVGRSRFYWGILPKLPRVSTITPTSARDRLVHRIANIWHTEAIRLAGRIWGDYKRRTRPVTDQQFRPKEKPITIPPFLSHLCV